METSWTRWARSLSVLPILVVLILATSASAQGLFSLPGLPSFGGFPGGSYGCGEKVCPAGGLAAYVGYMEDRNGTAINADTDGVGLVGITAIRHRFTNRGVWFGLAGERCLNDSLSFLCSGWYLVPTKSNSRENYNDPPIIGRTWDVDPQWWYVDGLFALRAPAGLTLLAGLRYDYYSVRFKNPFDAFGIGSLTSDTADAISQGWIPLFGTQYALSGSYGNLVVRAVGVPTLLGTLKYNQTVTGATRFEGKGNYNSGYFLEVFAEYSKSFGPGSVGIFGRWNGTDGRSTLDMDVLAGGVVVGTASYRTTVHRQSWTFGGSVSLDFNLPW